MLLTRLVQIDLDTKLVLIHIPTTDHLARLRQHVHDQPLAVWRRHEVGSLPGPWRCHCLACPRDVQGVPIHIGSCTYVGLIPDPLSKIFPTLTLKAEARSAALSSMRRPSCIQGGGGGQAQRRSSTRRTRSTDRTTRLLIALLGLFLIAETPMVCVVSQIND